LSGVTDVCLRRGVRRLSLFGSATGDRFDPTQSDVDVLVEFEPMAPAQHAEAYFGLQEDLQALFGAPVDIVEPGPIRNPYFRQELERNRIVLYEAG
jgi:hypothetical protein